MAKNLPARERSARRPLSTYSKIGKTAYSYPNWVLNAGKPPEAITLQLAAARRNPEAFRMPGFKPARDPRVTN